MNRVGLKDYLLNHADDNDLLDCAKAWDAANEYGQFDTYSSVEEAAQANGWDAAQALSEARRVNQDADFFRFNGYGHLETKQRIEFDAEQGDDFGEVSKYLGEFFNSGSVNQSEKINDSWGNSILVKGGNGRYDGPRGGITVYENFEEAVDTSPSWHGGDNIFADCEIDEIWDENGSLFVTGAHHDGRACVEMRQLTGKGEELYSEFETDGGFYLPETGFETMGFVYRKGDENAFIHDLWDNPEMCSKPRWAEKVGGSPAEEYIMEHDGVKTEFQITEVKEGSFAYDQGARFDVKVLTDGHDCGNGRFCADLNEAHEYCQQFADSIAGIGESLDDMCEDRSEIASAIQDAKVAERGQVDKSIGVEIDSQNDDDFITGTVTVDGESCYFYCPNNNRNPSEYDSAILEPFRPVGFEGDIEDVDLPAAIEENRNIVELVVSVAAAPYMDPDKLPSCEQGLDSLCEEKIDEAQTLRYGMEGVGLPMLDATENLANY